VLTRTPYAYAALEDDGAGVTGHLDASCKAAAGPSTGRGYYPDAWPCGRCVSLEQLTAWRSRMPDAAARGWAASRGAAAAEILPGEKKSLYFQGRVADTTGRGEYTPRHPQEDTTMNATTAPPTAAQFATLKVLFADVISADVPGMTGLRSALLDAHRAGTLTAEAVDQAISMLGDIVNPCNDDMPPATYPALPVPAPAPATFTKGQIVTNAAGQIVRVCVAKSGNVYGKVRGDDGTWEYAPGSMKGARHLTAEEAKAYGDTHHACVFCATPLTDERSTEKGYGPICADRYALPWG
jgi:hypothetical protein